VKKSKITMEELAELAGVSIGTISRALRDSSRVKPATRARIKSLADTYGYRVNQSARNLRLGKTGVISVVLVQEESTMNMSDPFFLEILGSIGSSLAEHDLDVLLATPPVPNILDLVGSRVFEFADGVIFIGQGSQHAKLNEIVSMGKPIVVWGAPMSDQKYSSVGSDNQEGSYAATKYLLGQGRKRIAFLGGDLTAPESYLRSAGYQQGLKEAGIAVDKALMFRTPLVLENLKETLGLEQGGRSKFDAIFCTSDLVAIATISTIESCGLKVPEDIAVVGFDDIATAKYNNPSLSTLKQDITAGGRLLVERLVAQIAGAPNAATVDILPSQLMKRSSTQRTFAS
jgi:DNA-binding LacI/PurR family transcriptional regulator